MRAAVYYNNNDIRIERMPKPKISEGELLVKVEASGICGSDVMEWYRVKKAPLVLGHEIAGFVVEVGRGVKTFKEGDRVTVAHHVPCNNCRYCQMGEHSVCDTLRSTNFDPGGFAQYVRVPAINVLSGVFKLPDSVSFEAATFVEPLGCVVRGLARAGMAPGKSVLVLGSGISGLLHIRLARASGASQIIATDINDYRLEVASASGADLTLDASTDVAGGVHERLGCGADIVVISVAADSAIEQALKSVGRGGTILFFAPKAPDETYPMPLFDLWRDNITIVNSYASPPGDTRIALELLESGRVRVSDMVTHKLPLDEAQRGFKLVSAAEASIKVIIEPNP